MDILCVYGQALVGVLWHNITRPHGGHMVVVLPHRLIAHTTVPCASVLAPTPTRYPYESEGCCPQPEQVPCSGACWSQCTRNPPFPPLISLTAQVSQHHVQILQQTTGLTRLNWAPYNPCVGIVLSEGQICNLVDRIGRAQSF